MSTEAVFLDSVQGVFVFVLILKLHSILTTVCNVADVTYTENGLKIQTVERNQYHACPFARLPRMRMLAAYRTRGRARGHDNCLNARARARVNASRNARTAPIGWAKFR